MTSLLEHVITELNKKSGQTDIPQYFPWPKMKGGWGRQSLYIHISSVNTNQI